MSASSRAFENNPNWGGGRVVNEAGYILVKVGRGHPLALANGYAYEHRLVAQEAMGRPLAPGEEVHHKNGVKSDNRPENLEVKSGRAEHAMEHRAVCLDRRKPGEPNPLIECGCGCGATMAKFHPSGRRRYCITGHRLMPTPTADTITRTLAHGRRLRVSEIAETTGLTRDAVKGALRRLIRLGLVSAGDDRRFNLNTEGVCG